MGVLSRASSVASSMVSLGGSLSRTSLSEYFAGSELDESNYNSDDNLNSGEDDEQLLVRFITKWNGFISRTNYTDHTKLNTKQSHHQRTFLPDAAQKLNPALYVTALNDLLQPYLQALRLTPHNPDSKFPTDEKKYDLPPPPAYSELYPVATIPEKQKFSLATRLSLRGRSFLRWTGMAGDAGLSSTEIEFLRREDGRRKTWTRDYMLLFFWVSLPPFLPSLPVYLEIRG